ncbi:MAG: LacI family DNA-binding transcriptional regulator [Pseudomonadota bacterium]
MTTRIEKKRANLRDVAKASGVSVATVSRVLNSPSVVSEKTLTRVQKVIEELRFTPSAAARAINSGRSRFVGALIPTLDNAIFAGFLEGLESQLADSGLSLIVATTNDDPEIEFSKAQELLNIGAEGLIISGISHSQALEKLVDRTQLPTIAISYYDPQYHLPTVGYDNRASARIAIEHLRSIGCQRVAVVHGPTLNNDRTRTRVDELHQNAGLIALEYFEADISVQSGAKTAKAILASDKQWDAILCLSDVLATGALFELLRHNIRIPEDMAIMGMEDLPSSASTYPRLTSVDLQVREMGVASASALANWIEHHERPESIKLEASLNVRQTTALRLKD